jgi:hypothetical protein
MSGPPRDTADTSDPGKPRDLVSYGVHE